MQHRTAQKVAGALVEVIAPHCERCVIAGSIRRGKEEVKDIELCLIPSTAPTTDLFGETSGINNLLWTAVRRGIEADKWALRWIKPGTDKIVDWHIKEDGKYWRGLLEPSNGQWQMKVDIFLASPENWGAIFLIRTGAADFSQAVVTHALKVGYKFEDGYLTCRGRRVQTPDEETVFDRLGLQFIAPEDRRGIQSLRAKPRK